MICICRKLAGCGHAAPIAEGALAILEVYEIKTRCTARDTGYGLSADIGLFDEGQHFFRQWIVAQCGEIFDRPITG
ncbi:hypothetical protein D3C71_2135290 [compost metagenome]